MGADHDATVIEWSTSLKEGEIEFSKEVINQLSSPMEIPIIKTNQGLPKYLNKVKHGFFFNYLIIFSNFILYKFFFYF